MAEKAQAEDYTDDSMPENRPRSIFWMFFWIAVAALVAKIYYLNSLYPFFEHKRRDIWFESLAAIAQADMAFAIIAGVVCGLILLVTTPFRRLHRILHALIRLFAIFCIAWVVISAATFDAIRCYPTWTVMYQAGGWRAPLGQLISRKLAIILAATIAGYFILYPIFTHFFRPRRPLWTWVSALFLLGALFCYWQYAKVQVHHFYGHRHDIRIADNAHWVLMKSIARNLTREDWVRQRPVFQPEDLRDFEDASNRVELPPIAPAGKRNVIVICLESVATRYLSIYGSDYATTPNLAAEAQHALIFDNFYSHVTNSGNSLYPMLLSKYPPLGWREAALTQPDAPGPSIANVLGGRGYRTAFISAGTTQYANGEKFLANRGFNLIQDFRDAGCPYYTDWGVEDRCMIDMMLRFIEKGPAEQPFFVFAWSNQTHWPYEPSPGQTEIDFLKGDQSYGNMSWDFGRYLNAIHQADAQIGRLIGELRKRNLADNTLLIITGDHGEGMGRPHPYYGHSGRLYQEDVNVPLFIWNPALFKTGSRSKTISAHIDLGPTILHHLNIPLAPSWQGHSLLDPAHPNRAYFFGSTDEYLLGVREGNFKYILSLTRERDELYDLSADPTEQNNLAQKNSAQTNRLRQRTAAWLSRTHSP